MNLLWVNLVTEEPTPEVTTPTPTPEPSATPTATPSPEPSDVEPSPDESTGDALSETPYAPVETTCGTMATSQDVCLHLTPDVGTFFGMSSLLVVLVLSALLAAQLRRS